MKLSRKIIWIGKVIQDGSDYVINCLLIIPMFQALLHSSRNEIDYNRIFIGNNN